MTPLAIYCYSFMIVTLLYFYYLTPKSKVEIGVVCSCYYSLKMEDWKKNVNIRFPLLSKVLLPYALSSPEGSTTSSG